MSAQQSTAIRRIDIEARLSKDRAWLIETYAAMDPADLERPATPSEHDPSTTWSAKDHLAHLVLIEQNFNAMVRRFLAGDPHPVGLLTDSDGRERSREEILAMVHEMTEEWKRKHEAASLSDIVALGQRTRADTLGLLGELSDEQLDLKLPGAPWADGTVGGVLGANADHGRMHLSWVKEGWDRG